MALTFYNSLTRKPESFSTHDGGSVGMYACGPTVYNYVSIGNWRTYMLGDIVVRTLTYSGYTVNYYMNITDVGHLTGDNEGDADTGEDRMEKAKAREGKTAWEVAKFYADDFKKGYALLNLTEPKQFLPATEYIAEQIALVQKLEANGFAYRINDGIYFDTEAYEQAGYTYGELSNLDQIKAGARVEFNTEKKNFRDFALWKFSPKDAKRDMEWESPWGVGFPGWHTECVAMSMQYLGEQFDVHIGGEDLKSTHHPNEIAQAQGATGKSPFVHFWLHGAFLQVDGGRMGKSLGNAYTLQDIEARGFSALDLRYFYFSGHYRSPLNFSWEGLKASATALRRIKEQVASLRFLYENEIVPVDENYRSRFIDALNDDLNMPVAIALLHELVFDKNIEPCVRYVTTLNFDEVFGFNFGCKEEIPAEVTLLVQEREEARAAKNWKRSDELRDTIHTLGYTIKDTDSGASLFKRS